MSSKRKQIDYDSDEKKKARMPPRTTLSHTNNITPNVTLDALGLNPVVEMPWTGGTTRHPKTSVLKFAIVKELQQYLIFFRFVPDVQPHGNYTEMFMFNMVRNNKPTFCKNLNVSHTWHSIYENNQASCNRNGFSFCAFKIITSTKPTRQILVMLGNALCEALNGIRQNTNIVRLETDNLFWLTQSNLVWADIVGDSKAQEYLLEKLGDTAYQTNVCDQNKDLIHSYFRPNRLPSELNQILGVPIEETFLTLTQEDSTEAEPHIDEGSHSPIILDTDEEEQL